jgi:hypothetical protein
LELDATMLKFWLHNREETAFDWDETNIGEHV